MIENQPTQPVVTNPSVKILPTNPEKKSWIISVLVVLVILLFGTTLYFANQNFQFVKKPTTTQPQPIISPSSTKTSVNTNDFLFKQNSQLWLGKTDVNGGKPVIQRFSDQTGRYVLSNSKDKVAFISDGYLKVKSLLSDEEITLQKLIPDNYPDEVPEPEYIRALGNISWSTNDTKLAFVGSSDLQADIYTIDIGGNNLKRLTNDKINEFSLSWSLDNKKIVFQTTEGFGTGAGFSSNIAIVDSDGNNYFQLIKDGKLPGNHYFNPAENLLWINDKEVLFSAWTIEGPDGIWKVNIDTKQVIPITDQHGFLNVVWSEIDNSFLYPLAEKNLLIVNIENGNKIIETKDEVDRVVWSNDGSKIAFTVRNNPNKPVTVPQELVYDLYLANKDGGNVEKIISNAHFIINSFVFSSDNKMVVYTKRLFEPDMHTELWIINSDGSNNRQIDSASDLYGPHTTPYDNLAIYSKVSSTGDGRKYTNYWVNLITLSKDTFANESEILYPKFISK